MNVLCLRALLWVMLSITHSTQAADIPAPVEKALNNDANEVYQYFVPGPEGKNLGAYLWVPPKAPVIRAVMVGIHNGLPLTILQNETVRKVCQEYGVAQVLMTPWSADLGNMLKDLNFDITDPAKMAICDRYMQALADLSGHPELTQAPVVPLAHSAFASFPFELAARDPGRCLMAIPIKAGLPNIYSFYAAGGKSKKPLLEINLAHVPILFCMSLNQCTVPGNWKSKALPYGSGSGGHPLTYRDDKDNNPGDTYQKGNELFGINWEMMSCHFDMSNREYEFIAQYLAAVCKARLPAASPSPGQRTELKPLTLNSGWLIDCFYSNFGEAGKTYYEPAAYTSYKGPKNRAYWYPTEELARTMQRRMISECAKKFEMFTLKDRAGEPFSLAESPQIRIPNPLEYLEKDGRFTLRIHEYTVPPLICTNNTPNHEKDPASHKLANVLFPSKTEIPVSKMPVKVDINGSAVERVDGPDFTFKLRPNRLSPDAGGACGACLRFYKDGDDEFAMSGRNVWIAWWPNGQKIPGIKDQTITFPSIADVPRSTKRIKLGATSSSGLPVGYFVQYGPAMIEGTELVMTQVPVHDSKPIKITVSAYQTGLWQNDGYKAAPTVFQSLSLGNE